MYEKNYYLENRITHPFGEDRRDMNIANYEYHEGIDYSSNNLKLTKIRSLFSGVIIDYGFDKIYGNFVLINHNPKFFGGVNSPFYSRYCHLEKIEKNVVKNKFIEHGFLLGKMGETGKYVQGIHLHLETFIKNVSENVKPLLLDMICNLYDIKFDVKNYFWKWNNLYINPLLIMEYFEFLKKLK
jgi:murein DD-endopeptidase MepM/ murein hydrolase activator NlpD